MTSVGFSRGMSSTDFMCQQSPNFGGCHRSDIYAPFGDADKKRLLNGAKMKLRGASEQCAM